MGKKKLSQPVILHEGRFNSSDLVTLRKHRIWRTIDVYENQLRELFEIKHPEYLSNSTFGAQKSKFVRIQAKKGGSWIYLPWSGNLIHMVGHGDFAQLVTNRNKNLITAKEQDILNTAKLGVMGLSVGSGISSALAYSGIGSTIKLADFDTLETCNLNRLRAGVHQIGMAKIDIAAQHIYEANPYLTVQRFYGGVKESNLDDFFNGGSRLDIIFDEIDDFKMKIMLRLKAKENKIPVIMFTNLGDNILIDIERYDLDNKPKLFNGLIGDVPNEILNQDKLSLEDLKKYAVSLIGPHYIPTRALASLPEIGKTLVGRPQLYGTVVVDGGIAAYISRNILLGKPIKSGRYFVRFADLVNMKSTDFKNSRERKTILSKLLKNA